MFAWVCEALDEPAGEAYQLADGRYSDVGRDQIGTLAMSDSGGPQVGNEDRRGRR